MAQPRQLKQGSTLSGITQLISRRRNRETTRFVRRVGAIAISVAVALVGNATPASAHQPVFLDENDPWPESGPLLVDGTISFAAYGLIDKPGATRGLSFNLQAGQPLLVELLIPDQLPETTAELPHVTVLDPDGVPTDPTVALGDRFDEPFSKTSYRRVAKVEATASKTGVWGAVVTNGVPGRFTLVVGQRETRGEVQRNDGVGSLSSWWSTSPPAAAPSATVPPNTTVASTTTAGSTAVSTATTTATTTTQAVTTTTAARSDLLPKVASKRRNVTGPAAIGVVALVSAASVAFTARRRVISQGRNRQ